MLGRETCLDEITWTEDGWPLVNRRRGPSYLAPLPLETEARGESRRDQEPSLSPELPYDGWMSPRSIDGELVQILPSGELQIRGQGLDLCCRDCRSLLVKRQTEFDFTCAFEMWTADQSAFQDAGIALYYDENTYIKFGLSRETVFAAEYVDDRYVRRAERPAAEFGWEQKSGRPVSLLVRTEGLRRSFFINGGLLAVWEQVTSLCSEGLIKGKRFTGATAGVYNNGTNLVCWRQHSNL